MWPAVEDEKRDDQDEKKKTTIDAKWVADIMGKSDFLGMLLMMMYKQWE